MGATPFSIGELSFVWRFILLEPAGAAEEWANIPPTGRALVVETIWVRVLWCTAEGWANIPPTGGALEKIKPMTLFMASMKLRARLFTTHGSVAHEARQSVLKAWV